MKKVIISIILIATSLASVNAQHIGTEYRLKKVIPGAGRQFLDTAVGEVHGQHSAVPEHPPGTRPFGRLPPAGDQRSKAARSSASRSRSCCLCDPVDGAADSGRETTPSGRSSPSSASIPGGWRA